MNKTHNWFGASALLGSIGVVLITSAMPNPAMSQSLSGSDSLYIVGGGGGGGGGVDGTGGYGAGSYVGKTAPTATGAGSSGTGTTNGSGGLGGSNGQGSNNIIDYNDTLLGVTGSSGAGANGKAGGNGGSVTTVLRHDLTIKDIILTAGNGGNAGAGGVGGNGGNVSFNTSGHELAVNETVQITSGTNGGATSSEQSKGGDVSFIANNFVVSQDGLKINLTKNDGALNFNVNTFDASNHSAKINLDNTVAGSNGSGVTFGDLIIGLSKEVDITGDGGFTLSNLTIGGANQTPFMSSAILNSAQAVSFNSNSTLTFYLPENTTNGTTLLNNSGAGIHLDGSKINLQMAGQHLNSLQIGDVVYLVSGNVDGYIDSTTARRSMQGYGAKEWTFDIAVADGSLTATSIDPNGGNSGGSGSGGSGGGAGIINQEKAKSYFQSNAASLNAVNFASDQVASLDDFVMPIHPQNMMDDVEIVALLQHSGYGERVETGSYIKNSGMNVLGGLGVRYHQQNGIFLANAFIEYGEADYDTFTSTTHGYGNTQYTGAGVYGKQSWDNGFFVDGSFRMGDLSSNYNSLDLNDGEFDNAKRGYYGWHLSTGKSFALSPVDSTTVYGRLTSNTIEEFTVTTQAGENLVYDEAESFRSLLGARYERAMSQYAKLYAGAAWEHEWDGSTGGTLDGSAINAPDFSGASAVFEFGGRFEAVPNMPGWTANAGVKSVTGKRDEVSGKLGLGYRW